jgi:hypothetical protein
MWNMFASGLIFLDFVLPNATTWFYFSLLLAVALFFKFSRFLSVRNLDVLTIFLLVPGLLLLREQPGSWPPYLWLFCGSGYFLARCLFDLGLVRRPALTPNLNLSGLAWLGGALFACLVGVAFRSDREQWDMPGKSSALLDHTEQGAKQLLPEQVAGNDRSGAHLSAEFVAGCSLALLCHLAIVAGLIVIGCRHFQDTHAGMAAATFYLLLPYTAFQVGHWQHVLPMALFVWAVALYRLPLVAGLLLGLGSGTMFFPALTFPVWWSFYHKRGAGRFSVAFLLTAALCLGILGIIWLTGSKFPDPAFSDWQPWVQPNPQTKGFWTGVHWGWAYRLPVFIAYLAFVSTMTLWPSPKNLAHLLALSAAAIIGVQFWYAEQGGVYVLWYLPLLLLLVFRPNLSERQPPLIRPESDRLRRFGHALGRVVLRLVRPPEPLVRAR